MTRVPLGKGETAIHGWVVLLGLRKLGVQPLANGVALLVGGILETDPGLIAVAFPCQLSIDFELLVHARQFEREAERVFFCDAAGKLDRHAAFAEIEGLGFVPARAVTLDRNLHSDPQLQPPFTLHQGANRTKAGFGALDRKGFVEDEMGPHFETALESDGRFHQHDREGSLVDGSGFGSSQHAASFLRIRPIYDDRFETLTGDPADGIVCGGAMFDVNFQVAEDPAQHAHRLFVGTQ